MKNFRFILLLPAFLVFATITGFSHLTPEILPKIPAPMSDDFLSADANKCVPAANATMLFGLLSTENATSQLFETSSESAAEIYVLEGGASKTETKKFGVCVATRLTCEDPTRLENEENGNVTVFCDDE